MSGQLTDRSRLSAEQTLPPGQTPSGGVVAVVGAKGGSGATLLSIHLAAARARTGRVGLLDFDFHRGGVAGALDLWVDHSLHKLVEQLDRVDLAGFQSALVTHAGGFHVLPQPFDFSELIQPRASDVWRMVTLAASCFERVVVDCGSRVDEAMLAVVTKADLVVVVSTPAIPALRDALRLVRLLRDLQVGEDRIRLVINHWTTNGPFSLPEIEAQLEVPVALTVPRDEAAFAQVDFEARPIWDVSRRSRAARALEEAWDAVAGNNEEVLLRMRRTS